MAAWGRAERILNLTQSDDFRKNPTPAPHDYSLTYGLPFEALAEKFETKKGLNSSLPKAERFRTRQLMNTPSAAVYARVHKWQATGEGNAQKAIFGTKAYGRTSYLTGQRDLPEHYCEGLRNGVVPIPGPSDYGHRPDKFNQFASSFDKAAIKSKAKFTQARRSIQDLPSTGPTDFAPSNFPLNDNLMKLSTSKHYPMQTSVNCNKMLRRFKNLMKDTSEDKVVANHYLYAVGSNQCGQLGISFKHTQELEEFPVNIKFLEGKAVRSIECGTLHSIVLTMVGEVYTAGEGQFGAIGHGDPMNIPQFKPVLALQGKGVDQIAAGRFHSLCVTVKGELYTFGSNDFNQCGLGGLAGTRRYTPIIYKPHVVNVDRKRVIAISAGMSHSACVTEDRMLYTWGRGDEGQLGHGDLEGRQTPTKVAGMANVTTVTCTRNNTFAVVNDRQIYSCGNGQDGLLGSEVDFVQIEFKVIQTFEDMNRYNDENRVLSIKGGMNHVMVLWSTPNEVYSWGMGSDGQLGHGNYGNTQRFPRKIEALADKHVDKIYCGERQSFCIISGFLYAWGNMTSCRLALYDEEGLPCSARAINLPYPVWEFAEKEVKVVASGSSHSIVHGSWSAAWENQDVENFEIKAYTATAPPSRMSMRPSTAAGLSTRPGTAFDRPGTAMDRPVTAMSRASTMPARARTAKGPRPRANTATSMR